MKLSCALLKNDELTAKQTQYLGFLQTTIMMSLNANIFFFFGEYFWN